MANIEFNHATILLEHANPGPDGISERTPAKIRIEYSSCHTWPAPTKVIEYAIKCRLLADIVEKIGRRDA
jgi:hypothetical protein